MKKIFLPVAAAAAITMTGCASMMDVNHQTSTGALSAEALSVVSRPQEFGVDVLGDTKGAAKTTKLFGFTIEGDKPDVSLPILSMFGSTKGADPLETLAAYRAAQAKGGDAFYRVTTEWDKFNVLFIYQRKSVEVTGKALKVKDLGTLSADRADKRVQSGVEAKATKGFLGRLFGG
ncbi:MAG: hypothetical protein KAG82_11255 [Alcanivoracaceae bacterium]|jgi:hypothetical protein|nr:hypothetical protein [Alcanivoracaceae bacterium]